MTATLTRPRTAHAPSRPPISLGLPNPPSAEFPAWALTRPPARDDAQRTLFGDDCARADRFWRWLLIVRTQAAERANRGHAYLSDHPDADAETRDLYRALCDWTAFADACLWLLTGWYCEPATNPTTLILPFGGFLLPHSNQNSALEIARDLRGLPDELLLEDALDLWLCHAVAHGQLTVVEGLPADPSKLDVAEDAEVAA